MSACVAASQATWWHGQLPLVQFETTRSTGLAFHPNSLAGSCVCALPLLLLLVGRISGRVSVAGGVLALVVGYALFLSGSRAGLIAGGCVIAVVTIVRTRSRHWGLAIRLAILCSVVLVVLLVGRRLLGLTRFAEGDTGAAQSTVMRQGYIREGVQIFLASPVTGGGLGSGAGVSVPVVVASSGGLVLVIAYYWYQLVPVLQSIRARHPEVTTACLVSVVGLAAYNLFSNGISERFTYWALCIGWSAAFCSHSNPRAGAFWSGAAPAEGARSDEAGFGAPLR